MTANKMMPTNGKRPEGLKGDDYVWIQVDGDDDIYCGRTRDVHWERIGRGSPVTYCPAEPPAPYVPKPDYSKWIGKVCMCWSANEDCAEPFILTGYDLSQTLPFRAGGWHWKHCRPVTVNEIVKE